MDGNKMTRNGREMCITIVTIRLGDSDVKFDRIIPLSAPNGITRITLLLEVSRIYEICYVHNTRSLRL